ARATQGAKKLGLGGAFSESQPKSGETAGEGRLGVIVDARNTADGEVEDGEGLEDIVELGTGEVNVDVLRATNRAKVLEETDAVLVEDDPADRELRGRLRVGGPGLGRRRHGLGIRWCRRLCLSVE